MKPFIRESYNGNKTALSAEEIAWDCDDNISSRLALVMYESGLITGKQFLHVIRPSSTIRERYDYDGDVS